MKKNAEEILSTEIIHLIEKVLGVNSKEIVGITMLKKGMTNRSFMFECRDKGYIIRIPGEGTEKLINRRQEAIVYHAISAYKIAEQVVYIDADSGIKIAEFISNARVCCAENENDLILCMGKLRELHSLNLAVDHSFDIFQQIDFYESLWAGKQSEHYDYVQTKKNVFSLRDYIEQHVEKKCLTHIDAIPDNFLITDENEVKLIDWEYSGMQDPHVDIAMFCIYSMYNKSQIDNLVDIYFRGSCTPCNRLKVYCYISACGLLWSNWCEYKKMLGIELMEYASCQYNYAKEYYDIVTSQLSKIEEDNK